MPHLKKISGEKCVKILCKHFDFIQVRQRGSHIVLKKTLNEQSIGTVVPNHKELKIGPLKGILKLAQIDEKEFVKFQ